MRQDEKVCALSRDARELFNGLITYADDEGRFRARRSEIVGHIFPNDDDAPAILDQWIGEIKDGGMILFYISDGTPYGAFRNWAKHQKINRPTPSDLPPPPSPKVVRENGLVRTGKGWRQTLGVSEASPTAHGTLTEEAVRRHFPAGERAFQSNPISVQSLPTAELQTLSLCHRLAFRIHANEPRSMPAWESAGWVDEMRLLVGDRGGSEEASLEVERIVDWCQADSFWRSNILSPAKLRKQFTQLVLKAQAGNVVPIGRRENTSDLLRALDGEIA